MKFRKTFLVTVALISVSLMLLAQANDQNAAETNDGPKWLKGVTISPYPEELSPVLPCKIYDGNGGPVPGTFTEDVPITVMADSKIFENLPPSEYKGKPIENSVWADKVAVSWFFIDWEENKNTEASTTYDVAANQMVITPLNPTGKGAVTCHLGRRMRYNNSETGKVKVTFCNSSGAKDVKVLDITPPTCGLEVSVKQSGKAGVFWAVENPPNKYPLPKIADIYLSGPLFVSAGEAETLVVPSLELGANMIVTPDKAALHVPADAILTFKMVGGDNYKLDDQKVKFGICAGAGGEPVPVGTVNPAEIDLKSLNLPDDPHVYIDATDLAGNRQVAFVPIKIN